MRLDPSMGLYVNTVRGWPSAGGIIIAERIQPVELAFLGLDRFPSYSSISKFNEGGWLLEDAKNVRRNVVEKLLGLSAGYSPQIANDVS